MTAARSEKTSGAELPSASSVMAAVDGESLRCALSVSSCTTKKLSAVVPRSEKTTSVTTARRT